MVVLGLFLTTAVFAQNNLMDFFLEQKGDTLVIKDYFDMPDVAGSLKSAIDADSISVPAGRVYELKAGGYYPLSSNVTTPATRPVVIVGADNTRLVNNDEVDRLGLTFVKRQFLPRTGLG